MASKHKHCYPQRNARHASTLQLTPGTVLVFYTDGLIESNHDILGGIASLERLIGSREFYQSANPAKFIRSHMLEGRTRDDVAILVVRMRAPLERTSDSTRRIYCWTYDSVGPNVLSAVRERLERVLRYMLDEQEFLSPYGIRSVSRVHRDKPYVLRLGGQEYRVEYEPGESSTALRVTSEPVPAVVGMAMKGAAGRASGRPPPITSR